MQEITDLQTGLEGMNWIPETNLHITLGYFGALPDEITEILDRELGRQPSGSFDLRLSGGGTFGRQSPHTLWLGVDTSPALSALHDHVRRAARRASVILEKRKYTPHLSLAYPNRHIGRSDLAKFLKRMSSWRSAPFLVDEFSLYSSHRNKSGPNTYLREANYPLLG